VAVPADEVIHMVTIDIPSDLNDEDETGFVWTFLDEARSPDLIVPGALLVTGDEDSPAVAQVVDLVAKANGTIVHLRVLPGTIEEYRALVERTVLAS
jgi:hypothetical protein